MSIGKQLRDFFILRASVFGVSFVYRMRIKKHGPLVRVLVFHDVQDVAWFKRSIACIASKYHVVSPEEFLNREFNVDKINVLITFDDGYASWTETCHPVFAEKNIKALFFINSGLIDAYGDAEKQSTYVHDNLMLSSRMTLSWEGVRILANAGHTIGGHTISHMRLSSCTEAKQQEEIINDKARIEEKLGQKITTFAYPFGQRSDYTKSAETAVLGAGYTHAFTTEGVFADVKNPLSISRLCVEEGQSVQSLERWIEGGYDVYRKLKSLCVR